MQDYEEPVPNNPNINNISTSPSMYGRIRAWLLNEHEEITAELIKGTLINLKVLPLKKSTLH